MTYLSTLKISTNLSYYKNTMEHNDLVLLIRETINEELNKKGLFEMSVSKSDAIRKFNNTAEEIVDHLFKLFIYQNSPNYNKWKKEISTFVIQSGSYIVKSGNGKLKASEYFNGMFQYIETDIDKENKYKVVVSKFNLNAIRRDIKNVEQPLPYNYFLKYVSDIVKCVTDISIYLSENKNLDEGKILMIINRYLPKFN